MTRPFCILSEKACVTFPTPQWVLVRTVSASARALPSTPGTVQDGGWGPHIVPRRGRTEASRSYRRLAFFSKRASNCGRARERGITDPFAVGGALRRNVERDALTEAPDGEDLAVDDATRPPRSLLRAPCVPSPSRVAGRSTFAARTCRSGPLWPPLRRTPSGCGGVSARSAGG